jgi:hypothetical protein
MVTDAAVLHRRCDSSSTPAPSTGSGSLALRQALTSAARADCAAESRSDPSPLYARQLAHTSSQSAHAAPAPGFRVQMSPSAATAGINMGAINSSLDTLHALALCTGRLAESEWRRAATAACRGRVTST